MEVLAGVITAAAAIRSSECVRERQTKFHRSACFLPVNMPFSRPPPTHTHTRYMIYSVKHNQWKKVKHSLNGIFSPVVCVCVYQSPASESSELFFHILDEVHQNLGELGLRNVGFR